MSADNQIVRVQGAITDAPPPWLPEQWDAQIMNIASLTGTEALHEARIALAQAFAQANGCVLSLARVQPEHLGTTKEERAELACVRVGGGGAWDHPWAFKQDGKLAGIVVHLYGAIERAKLPTFLVADRLPDSWYAPGATTAYLYRAKWSTESNTHSAPRENDGHMSTERNTVPRIEQGTGQRTEHAVQNSRPHAPPSQGRESAAEIAARYAIELRATLRYINRPHEHHFETLDATGTWVSDYRGECLISELLRRDSYAAGVAAAQGTQQERSKAARERLRLGSAALMISVIAKLKKMLVVR